MNRVSEIWDKGPGTFELSENLVHIWKARIEDSALNIEKLYPPKSGQGSGKRQTGK